jgi:hypothetical protein
MINVSVMRLQWWGWRSLSGGGLTWTLPSAAASANPAMRSASSRAAVAVAAISAAFSAAASMAAWATGWGLTKGDEKPLSWALKNGKIQSRG